MDNTLIIFTSDNGAIFHKEYVEQGQDSNLGLLGQKTDVWEGGMRELTLQKRLGHASPEATRIYTRVSDSIVVAEYRHALGFDDPADDTDNGDLK